MKYFEIDNRTEELTKPYQIKENKTQIELLSKKFTLPIHLQVKFTADTLTFVIFKLKNYIKLERCHIFNGQ